MAASVIQVEIETPTGQHIKADLSFGKMTDVLTIDVPPLGLFTITGKSARYLKDALNQLVP